MRGRKRSKYPPPPRDLEFLLETLRGRARSVVLWREYDDARGRWKYLGRFNPYDHPYGDIFEFTQREFGPGHYRAKVLGRWDPELRREEYLGQDSFWIADPTTGR